MLLLSVFIYVFWISDSFLCKNIKQKCREANFWYFHSTKTIQGKTEKLNNKVAQV